MSHKNEFKDTRIAGKRERDMQKIVQDCHKNNPGPKLTTAADLHRYQCDSKEALKRLESGEEKTKKELAKAKADCERMKDVETKVRNLEEAIEENERKLREAREEVDEHEDTAGFS